jgi:exopolyphosphatase/pppGpp-phosphohydrolase
VISQAQGAPVDQLARRYSLGAQRARTVLAGAIILAEAARLAGRPLEVSSTGLREGLAAELLELRAA